MNIASAQALFQLSNHAKTASGWGMGNAVSSLNNSFDGIFQNPASLAETPKFIHANFTNFILGINTTSIAYVQKQQNSIMLLISVI